MTATAWDRVAAVGTDPGMLAAVVAAMVADETGTRRRLADALEDGADAAAAVAAVVPGPRLVDPTDGRPAASWRRAGVRAALLGDPGYPPRAARVPGPPPLIATRGDLEPLATGPVVAIVGARAASEYGRGVAAWLAEAAAEAGAHVLSGGAVGIDAAAHAAAADLAGGSTVVLGCGHGVAYPRPHAATGGLFDRVVAGGGAVVSESLPGAPPRPHRVRARNRLVAGLADVVVVVEGGARSGSLLTATAAGDAGVTVMAVPGDVRAPGSRAPHRLLVEGAVPCTTTTDLLDVLGVVAPAATPASTARRVDSSVLPEAVHRVLAQAWPRPVSVESLATRAEVTTGSLLAALTRARLQGVVAQGPRGVVFRRAP